MRKVQGIKSLMVYLDSVDYPLSEEKLSSLVQNGAIPHTIPIRNMIIFDLAHIDWWVAERRQNSN
ncbi:MAG: hypothetical protein KKF57_11700 [Firmicutes bacterium]|nr:hypothetical protein [Bacillota bacterium]